MAFLVLDRFHQEQLGVLHDVDVDTVAEFCKVALQLFRNGPQPKMIEKAAKKLTWPPEKLQATMEAIMDLFKEAVKADVSLQMSLSLKHYISRLID
jgi:succinyl-CoA synthetase beta subunit